MSKNLTYETGVLEAFTTLTVPWCATFVRYYRDEEAGIEQNPDRREEYSVNAPSTCILRLYLSEEEDISKVLSPHKIHVDYDHEPSALFPHTSVYVEIGSVTVQAALMAMCISAIMGKNEIPGSAYTIREVLDEYERAHEDDDSYTGVNPYMADHLMQFMVFGEVLYA